MAKTLKAVGLARKIALVVQKASVKIKILFSLWQILSGIGATFSIPFPPFYEQVVSAVGGVLQVQLPSIMPLGCIVETNYHYMLIFKCLWPLGVYALLYLSSKFLNMRGNEAKADACIDLAFFLMFVMYPSLSNSLLSMFYCYPLEDGTSWLRTDLSVQCTSAPGVFTPAHAGMLTFTFVMLIVHTIGTPAIYAYLLLWKFRGKLDALKEQELDNAHREKVDTTKQYVSQYQVVLKEERAELKPEDLLPGYMLKLTNGYEWRTYWFELFETLRKVLLVGIPAVFPERGGTAQLFWGLLICFMSAGFYMMAAPYIEDSDDHLAQLAQLQIFLTLLSSLALRAIPPSEVVGNLVTVILFAVPVSGIIFQTELFDDLAFVFGKLRKAFIARFPNFHPPIYTPPNGATALTTTSEPSPLSV